MADLTSNGAPDGAPDATPGRSVGGAIIRASWAGTVLFVVAATAATLVPDTLGAPFAVLSVVYLLVGIGLFVVVLLIAASRSRTDAIGIGGLFFLQGSAPRSVQRQLMASFAVEVVVAFVAASIRIYTPLAFGILVPMYGLGLAGLWGARHGSFGPRVSPSGPSTGEGPG
jgi:hypothetical protein